MHDLLVRADAGSAVGAGHLMRCLALADAWTASVGDVTFVSRCDSSALRGLIEATARRFVPVETAGGDGADLRAMREVLHELVAATVVLDGYHFDADYHDAVRKMGARLVVIDDVAHLPRYRADVLLNQNPYAEQLVYESDPDCILLLGPRYALLRREFLGWLEWRRETRPVASRVLVTMGGGDGEGVTKRVVEALEGVRAPSLEVRIVVGPFDPRGDAVARAAERSTHEVKVLTAVPDMAEVMAWADLAITSAGSTCYESLFMGLPSLVVVSAENQLGIARSLSEMGAVVPLGGSREIGAGKIADALGAMIHDAPRRERMSAWGRDVVDGRGVERVVRALADAGPDAGAADLRLRRADMGDAFTLWQWANDPETRRNSFRPAPIAWESHRRWYAEKLATPDTRIWVLESRGVPFAQVRYDRIEARVAQISFSVSRPRRGRGLGTRLLEMSVAQAGRELGVQQLQGIAFADNPVSARAFLKAGFELAREDVIAGHKCLMFCRELDAVP